MALAILAFSGSVSAYTNSSGTVERIFPNDGSSVYFRLSGDTCNTGSDYYYFNLGQANAKNWNALLLLAFAMGKPISVSLDNCDAGNKAIRYLFIDR